MNVILPPAQAQPLFANETEVVYTTRAGIPKNNAPAIAQSFNVGTSAIRGRILLVDDNKCLRETLAELLEIVGFHVLQAQDAIAAMTLFTQVPDINAMVTDLTMPGDNGITLIRQARRIKDDIPAILLTGYAEQVTSVATIAGSNVHVLRKPVECDRLIALLDLFIQTPPIR